MSDAASMVFARWRVLTGARWSKLDGACKITRLILPYNPDQKKLQDHPNELSEKVQHVCDMEVKEGD